MFSRVMYLVAWLTCQNVQKSTCIWWPGLHVMGCECSEEYVSGGLAYMSWDVNVQKSICIWWPGLHVMGCECSEEYMYLVAWLTCHGM